VLREGEADEFMCLEYMSPEGATLVSPEAFSDSKRLIDVGDGHGDTLGLSQVFQLGEAV